MRKGIFLLVIVFFLIPMSFHSQSSINIVLSEDVFKTGMIRFNNREYQAAIQLFNKSLGLDPMNLRARYYLGYAYLNAGYTKNAIEEWENLIMLGGGTPQIKQKLNDLYFQLAIDKSYDYSQPYILWKIYDGIIEGRHQIIRPSFMLYDEKNNTLLVSSIKTKYVVEMDADGNVFQQFGRKLGDLSVFEAPTGIALYNDKLYAADYEADKIFVFDRKGGLLFDFGIRGYSESNLAGPMGLYISPDEYLFIVDNGNDRIQKFDLDGKWIQNFGKGMLDRPTDVVGEGEYLYISDTFNKRIVKFDLFGNMIESFGEQILQEPRGLCLKGDLLYIVDARQGIFIYNIVTRNMDKLGVDQDQLLLPFDTCVDTKDFIYESDFNSQYIGIFSPLQLHYANIGIKVNQIWLQSYPQNFIHLRIWDKQGKPIYDISDEDILVYEEDELIPFVRLGTTYEFRKDMYIKFIIDKSLSMQAFEPEFKEIFGAFLDKMSGSDWIDIGLVDNDTQYSGRIDANLLWSMDYTLKHPYESQYPYTLGKAMYDSITGLLNVNRNKALLLIVSGELGEQTFSVYDEEVILTYARENAIPIYIIAMTEKNKEVFQELASQTFGKYYSLKDIKSILNLHDEIKNSKPLEYILGYEGLNLKGLKNYWVDLHIEVKLKMNTMIGVDDTGYFVPETIFLSKDKINIEEELSKKEQ
ncbi:MAG: hypothetical protein A2Y33_11530 [Spirochaetes bacterium GWF1_51_8]|nr:MAG: hypothetical protein A2Y33_11530 [Spirochaetes bacterium GWF1_51_8]